MITGHFAAGMALKPQDNAIPLWALLVASQFMDIVGMMLVMLGVERMEPEPGISALNSMDMYLPYSHSLIMVPVWMIIGAILYKLWRGEASRRDMSIIAIIIASHWILDFISHVPDLPLWFATEPVFGLGLWNSVWGTITVETTMLALAVWLFLRAGSVQTPVNKIAFATLVLAFLLFAVASEAVPLPESGREKAVTALILFAVVHILAVLSEMTPRSAA